MKIIKRDSRNTKSNSYQIVKWEDLNIESNKHLKQTIKRELINFFDGDICFFTELADSQSHPTNIEHFIPRNKDTINFEYDFEWENLYICNKDFNTKKGNRIDQHYDIHDFRRWKEFVDNADEYFEYKEYPEFTKESDKQVAKELNIPTKEIRIELSSKLSHTEKGEIQKFIDLFELNSFRPTGRDSENISRNRFRAFSIYKKINVQHKNFPSMFAYFAKS